MMFPFGGTMADCFCDQYKIGSFHIMVPERQLLSNVRKPAAVSSDAVTHVELTPIVARD